MNLDLLEKNLGVKFHNRSLLERALHHRSYLNEVKDVTLQDNERLEFLGDSVLQVCVSRFLYQNFPQAAEGVLTNYRSSLVKTQTLAKVGKNLSLGDFLLLSKGEEESGGRKNESLLADCFEAIIAAIYLDTNLETAYNFISQHLLPLLSKIIENKAFKDFKSLLQEKTQTKNKVSPKYQVAKTEGPDHERIFTIEVFVAKKSLGKGVGRSKQEAEQEAAKEALKTYERVS